MYNLGINVKEVYNLYIKIIGAVGNLKVEEESINEYLDYDLGFGPRLSQGIEILKKEFSQKDFIESIGMMEANYITGLPYVYQVQNISELPTPEKFYDLSLNIALEQTWGPLHAYLLALWLVKDNSINIKKLYGYLNGPNKSAINEITPPSSFSNSEGEYKTISFKFEELQKALEWLKVIVNYLIITDPKAQDIMKQRLIKKGGIGDNTDFLYANNNRFSRALRFIQVARTEQFLPVKIASYIGALESIFDVDFELAHQVSERAAKLVGGDIDTRVENYDLVKDAYNLRSKYVHGSELGKKYNSNDKMKTISKKLDNLLRTLMQNLLLEHPDLATMKQKDLTDWFKKLILQGE